LRNPARRAFARHCYKHANRGGPENTYVSSSSGVAALPKDMSLRLDVAHSEVRGASAAIRFFPDGGATGGDIVIDLGGSRAKISVNWLTGGALCALDQRAAAASL
jgi:hypothetical protein